MLKSVSHAQSGHKRLTVRVSIGSIAILCWGTSGENGGKNKQASSLSLKTPVDASKYSFYRYSEALQQCRKSE